VIKILIDPKPHITLIGHNGEILEKVPPKFESKHEAQMWDVQAYYNSPFVSGREKLTVKKLVEVERKEWEEEQRKKLEPKVLTEIEKIMEEITKIPTVYNYDKWIDMHEKATSYFGSSGNTDDRCILSLLDAMVHYAKYLDGNKSHEIATPFFNYLRSRDFWCIYELNLFTRVGFLLFKSYDELYDLFIRSFINIWGHESDEYATNFEPRYRGIALVLCIAFIMAIFQMKYENKKEFSLWENNLNWIFEQCYESIVRLDKAHGYSTYMLVSYMIRKNYIRKKKGSVAEILKDISEPLSWVVPEKGGKR